MEMIKQIKSLRGLIHNQPDQTGSLLRQSPHVSADWVSFKPVPNGVNVVGHESFGEFTLISYGGDRGWVRSKYLTTLSPSSSTPSFKLTTYNILTGGAPWKGISQYEAETTGKPYAIWKNRKHLVVEAIRDSEIIMLNETTDTQLLYIQKELGISIVSRALKKGEYDGSAILVNTDKWKVLDTFQSVIFEKHTQVVVAVHLQNIESNTSLYLVCLHLKSGYADMENRRCEEFKKAMRLIFERFPNSTDSPLVVAGDLNSDYREEFAVLIKHMLPAKFPMLRNAAADEKGIGVNTPTYNFWHESVFDYILISRHIEVQSMHTQSVGDKAPNKKQGSDHFPVSSVLKIL